MWIVSSHPRTEEFEPGYGGRQRHVSFVKRKSRPSRAEFHIDSLALDADIPEYLFSKAALRR